VATSGATPDARGDQSHRGEATSDAWAYSVAASSRREDMPRLPPVRLASRQELAAAARAAPLLRSARDLAIWADTAGGPAHSLPLSEVAANAAANELELTAGEVILAWRVAVATGMVPQPGAQGHAAASFDVLAAGSQDEVLGAWLDAFESMLSSEDLDGLATALYTVGTPVKIDALFDAYSTAVGTVRARDADEPTSRQAGGAPNPSQAAALSYALETLADLGAVELGTDETVGGLTVALSPLGIWGVHRRLRLHGWNVPELGEGRDDAPSLLAALATCDVEDGETEITAWLAVRNESSAAAELIAAAAAGSPGLRGAAFAVLDRIGQAALEEVRAALEVPLLRAHAAVWLHEHGEEAELGPADRTWLLVDLGAGLLEEADPRDVVAELLPEVAPEAQAEIVAGLWHVNHPGVIDLLTTLSEHHPDPGVARAARKAAFKVWSPSIEMAAVAEHASAKVKSSSYTPTLEPGLRAFEPDEIGRPRGGGSDRTDNKHPQHFLVADMPASSPMQFDVSLIVRITEGAPSSWHPRHVAMKSFETKPDGTKITLIVQAPAGLRPTEQSEQVLTVPPTGDSEPARFAFRAERPGLFRIGVTAFAGGTFVGELVVELSVETRTRRAGSLRTVKAHLESLRTDPGEVTLQVRYDEDRYTFQLLSDSCFFEPVLAQALTAHPSEGVERTLRTLRAMADQRSGFSPPNARTWMQETGIGLWNDMVPALIKEQFWQLRPSISSFSIACDRDTIPWELLYPLSASGDDSGFLVEQFPVMRRAYGQRRSRQLSLGPARWVIPPKSPTNAEQEVGILQRAISPQGTEPIRDLAVLLELINAGHIGLLHFACHNNFVADSGGSSIVMAGGPFEPGLLNRAVTTRSLALHSPLVFVNACRSAGVIPEYTRLLGWASQFMAAGAGAFVGTLWAVPSDSASLFAEVFYDSLVRRGRALGASVLAARQATAQEVSDPTWLAYTVYGDPGAMVTSN
jgi:hypothetical protein